MRCRGLVDLAQSGRLGALSRLATDLTRLNESASANKGMHATTSEISTVSFMAGDWMGRGGKDEVIATRVEKILDGGSDWEGYRRRSVRCDRGENVLSLTIYIWVHAERLAYRVAFWREWRSVICGWARVSCLGEFNRMLQSESLMSSEGDSRPRFGMNRIHD